jgi:UDP-3-O-[3-hydroxymyristoyl] glucosamine N-acyltransferase
LVEKTLTVAEAADIVGGQVVGDSSTIISRVASIERAGKNDISFLSNAKFAAQLDTTQASCVLLSNACTRPNLLTVILCDDPYLAFAKIAQRLDVTPELNDEISKYAIIDITAKLGSNVRIAAGAVIGSKCQIGDNVSIGANCCIGESSILGEGTKLYPNVTIYHGVEVGKACIFHSGAVVGSDGFGYANERGKWIKIPQAGGVIIGDDVEVGANATIDRGALNDTIIENGVKIDNLCHIAHNVKIGQDSAMAAFTGIAGSANIGKSCTFSGRSSVIGHLDIAAGTHLTACTLVNKSNPKAAIFSSGTGAQENKIWRKNVARFKQLDDMAKRLKFLEKQLENLQEK